MRILLLLALLLAGCGTECNFGIDGDITPEDEVAVWRVYEAVKLHGYKACCRVRLIYCEDGADPWLKRVDTPCRWAAGTWSSKKNTAAVNLFCFGREWMPGTLAHEIGHAVGFRSEANARLFARGVMYHYNQLLEEEAHGQE